LRGHKENGMKRLSVVVAFCVLILLSLTAGQLESKERRAGAQRFDLVLAGGRVIDPETGLDAIRNVGVRGDTITQVSTERLEGTRTIDARGLVVAPGFIDLHEHGQNPEAYRLLALDGVTAALELEIGVPDIRRFIDARAGHSLIHFGATASYLAARVLAWDMPLPASIVGPEAGIIPQSGPATNEPASRERLERILATLRSQIETGALGIGMGLEYAPGATRHEAIEVFKVAASHGIPVFVHVRSAGRIEPGSSIESVSEVIGAAAISGAALHIVHINSSCLRDWAVCLSMIAGARARGLDVTTEAYPYTAGMTLINSAHFNPGWREKRNLDYSDLELPESGERLTRERFEALHAAPEPRLILIHMNPDEVVDGVIADPLVAIASDGVKDHPRGAGTHARVLARYVRDQKRINFNDAIRKMSLMPAQRLEKATPEAKRLGRLQQGAQADIVVFDPQTVQDRATFRAPTEASAGVRYLVVAGTVVVDSGRIVEGVAPGRAFVRTSKGRP
jgi:N-acyl-D-aspartate/D-glutamate deacylase